MEKLIITPQNVCARQFIIEHENGIVKSVKFIGGCPGNGQGVCRLVEGLTIEEVIKKLEGIKCPGSRNRITSCPNELAQGLKALLK